MDGIASPLTKNNKWGATVQILIHDMNHNPVANATVSGNWSEAGIGSGGTGDSCVTNASGLCSVSTRDILENITSTTFTIGSSGVSHATLSYLRSDNHDPNGCETGTCDSITVVIPGSGAAAQLEVTKTPTNTPASTPTNTPANTPTNAPADTPTNTPANTPTNTPTSTPMNTPAGTPLSATNEPVADAIHIGDLDGSSAYSNNPEILSETTKIPGEGKKQGRPLPWMPILYIPFIFGVFLVFSGVATKR